MSLAIVPCQTIAPPYKGSLNNFEELIESETTTIEQFNKKRSSLPAYELISGGDFGCNALSKAAYLGNVDLIQFIFTEYGPEILKIGDIYGRIPLHYAAIHRKCDSIYTLICLGSPINMTTVEEYYDYDRPLQNLYDDDVPETVSAGATPMDLALRTHDVGIIMLLKFHGGLLNLTVREMDKSFLVEAETTLELARYKWMLAIKNATDNKIFPTTLLGLIADYALWEDIQGKFMTIPKID